ncbi:MAG: hypothetical protein U5K79_10995 [Cyclobacteriaceae bacterium]|nr:hypothetical protein [Cyclobacteriaceae bacterium]
MKRIIKYTRSKVSLIFLTLLITTIGCDQSEDAFSEYDLGPFQQIADPYLQILTPVVSFQAGTPSYVVNFNTINGLKQLTKVDSYKVYTDAKTGSSSEPVLFTSYTIDDPLKVVIQDEFTYDDLKAGITVDGASLPDNQAELAVGSGWVLSYKGTTVNGDEVSLAGVVNVAVLSRFAGIYRVVDMEYWRIGVDRPDVYASQIGTTRFIGSVDENTFKYNDYWGPFAWTGGSFNFDIDFTTNSITVPIICCGLFSGTYATSCATYPEQLTNVPCGDTSNKLIPDDATGKHRMILTYGYFSEGSGPREFWEILEKVVD